METTTIRVDKETHSRLAEMSRENGVSIGDTVRQAAEALHRQKFAARVAAELSAMRQDPGAWKAYLADAESFSVTDGLP
jgi:Ribbon-helix-helix protein, copG family